MIYENLPKAVNKEREAIDNMGVAQYIAGMGFSNVGLGIVHSLAHQLGALYHVPHGFACALFLPYVLKWNGTVAKERYREIARAFKENPDGLSDDECVDLVVKKVRDLEQTLNLKTHLREYGVKEEDFEKFAEKALIDHVHLEIQEKLPKKTYSNNKRSLLRRLKNVKNKSRL